MTRDLALGCALSVKLKLRGMTHMTKMREGRNLKSSKRLKSKIKVETFKAEGEKCKVCWKINKGKCERHG